MEFLTDGILALTWQQIVMFAVGITLIWLAIKKGFEPALLLPMGFGAILVNLPFSGVLNQTLAGGIQANGVIEWLFHVGIEASEVMPILLFIGIGAMIDFGPLLSKPSLFLFGAGAQLGIFAAILLSTILGFDLKDAASIGIIGAADGPTSILVSQVLNSKYIGAIAVAAYSYMALVPIVQPFAIRLVTTKKERCIHMEYNPKSVSKTMKIAFPIIVTVIGAGSTSIRCAGWISHVRQPDPGMRRPGHPVRHSPEYSGKSDHPASWNHHFLQHACRTVCNKRDLTDPGDRTFCFCHGHHRRRSPGKIYESFPEKEDQSYDRRRRNFCISNVLPCSSENGHGRRSHKCNSHASRRCQRVRTDCFCNRRRHGYQPGDKIFIKNFYNEESLIYEYIKYHYCT